MITGTSIVCGGGIRKAKDFYPTPPEAVYPLLTLLNMPLETVVWEPACGDGAIAKVLISKGYSTISTDIANYGYGEPGVDFLVSSRECGAIITNPPFNLAKEFIEHALTQASLVCILHKSQFWHSKKRYQLFLNHPPYAVCPLLFRPDFSGGGAPTMEVCWSIWIKGYAGEAHYHPLPKEPK